jgi:4-carboxymuconolactone decarboxylase
MTRYDLVCSDDTAPDKQPRIAPITEPTGDVTEMLAKGWMHDGQPLNMPLTLAHHPRLLRRFSAFAGLFLMKSELPRRDRELLTLRSTARSGAEYYFGHHALVAEEVGISSDMLEQIADPNRRWDGPDAELIAVADEMIEDGVLADGTWDVVRRRYNDAQAMEAILIPGFYRMVAGLENTIGVQREPGVPGWPNPRVIAPGRSG